VPNSLALKNRSPVLKPPCPGSMNANMRKEKNFFETKVTEYQTGAGLKWD
jgi:hypothetical protein